MSSVGRSSMAGMAAIVQTAGCSVVAAATAAAAAFAYSRWERPGKKRGHQQPVRLQWSVGFGSAEVLASATDPQTTQRGLPTLWDAYESFSSCIRRQLQHKTMAMVTWRCWSERLLWIRTSSQDRAGVGGFRGGAAVSSATPSVAQGVPVCPSFAVAEWSGLSGSEQAETDGWR